MNLKTKQDIYDFVGDFLIKQGVRSADSVGSCFYRGPNGLKCAVGAVLSDHYYRKDMEGSAVESLNKFKLPKFIKDNATFLGRLQNHHDWHNSWNENGFDVNKYINFGRNNFLNVKKFEKLV